MSHTFTFKVEHLIVAFFLVAFLPLGANAQSAVAEPVEGVVVANVRLSDASVISHEPGKLNIGFILTNQGETTQLDIRYGFELVKTTDGTQTIVDTFVSPETLVLTPGQSLEKKVDYFAPTFLSGEYKVYVIAKTTGGLMLGLGKAGTVTFSENAPYVEISPESCVLNVEGDIKNYTLYQGVDVSSTEKFSISCDIENHFDSAKTITQHFETFRRSLYGEPTVAANVQTELITLSVNERKNVSFAIPLANSPQAYDATLVLVDTETGTPLSNKVSFHYVIRGESATIKNVSFDKSSYTAGDLISASVSWAPSADQFPGSRAGEGTELDKVTALLRVTDDKGKVCAESDLKTLSTETLDFIITANAVSDCVSPTAAISLIDKNRNILDSRIIGSLEQSKPFLAPAANVTTQGPFESTLFKISILVLTLLLISGVILVIKRRNHNEDDMSDTHSPYKILIYILLFSSSLFVGAGQVSAVTFAGQGNVWQFTVDSNKTSYSPSETISLDSSIYANVCGNTASNAYLEATLEGQNIPLQSGAISGGQTLYGGGQLTAPTTPGVYLIVLKGCGGDLCYANPPQGDFYASIPITVIPPPTAPNAWWSPTNITVAGGGTYSMGYGSLNATRCDIWKNGVLVGVNAPTWYFYNNLVANEPSFTSQLICYNSRGIPSAPANFTLTVIQPAVNASCGSANGVQTATEPTQGLCSAGSQSSVVDNINSFNWSCFGQSGGSNDSCVAPKPQTVTATIDAPNCGIPLNGSNCSSNSVTWSSTNATVPSVRQDDVEFSTDQGPRSEPRTIGFGTHTFSFYDNNGFVNSDTAEAFCVVGTTWNNGASKCVAVAAPDLVPSFNPTGTFNVGTAIPLTGTVTNIGSLNVGNFSDNFSFWNGASWMDITPFINHPSLGAGGSQATDFGSYTPTQSGTLQLQYCVDSFNQITNESSESNCIQVSVNVGDSLLNPTQPGPGCDIGLILENGACVAVQAPPQITIEANPNIIRTGQTTAVVVGITAGYNMECTLSGVNLAADTFTHLGGPSEHIYPYTTRPLTSTQVVQISCTDGTTVTTKQVRIEMIGTIQEI